MLDKLTAEQIQAYKEAGVLDGIIETWKEVGQKNDVDSGVPYSNPAYSRRPGTTNQYGIFTQPGVRPQTYSTLNQPLDIVDLLNPVASEFLQERVGILTGQTDMTGNNAEDSCSTPPVVGDLKTCQQNYILGTLYLAGQKMTFNDAGKLANRAVLPEREIMNTAPRYSFYPDLLTQPNLNVRSWQAQTLFQMGTAIRRATSQVMITGNPATASASTVKGYIQEFNGLDTLVKTGYVDAVTGNACAAADSVVVSWNALTTATVGGNSLGQVITNVYNGRQILARQLGVEATWAFIMHPTLFLDLVYAYASTYYINRLTAPFTSSAVLQTASERVTELALDMYANQYLLINNVPVPVVFSDGIPVGSAGNYGVSDIYMVPLTINGAPGIQFEYFPMNNQYAQELAAHFNDQIMLLNNGMYMMVWERTKFCVEPIIKAQFRMFLNAPFLAGRIDDVQFQLLTGVNYRSPLPGSTGYSNGGSSYYADIN